MRAVRLPALLVFLWIVVLGVPARAQDAPAVAQALFEEGRRALAAGDYETACKKFRESDRIDAQPGTKMNLAKAELGRNHLATAWALYLTVIEALPPDDPRVPLAKKEAGDLDARVPRLVFQLEPGAPADTEVRIGEMTLRADGFGAPLPVDPGRLTLEVRAPGHEAAKLEVVAQEGTTRTVQLAPGPALPQPPPGPAPLAGPSPGPAPLPVPEDPGMSAQATAGWVVGGLGLVVVLAGVGTGIGGLVVKGSADDHCDAERAVCDQEGADGHDTARALLTSTTVLWIVGGVAMGTGLVLLLTGGDDEEPAAALEITPGGARLRMRY
jgi:hypothetical protein